MESIDLIQLRELRNKVTAVIFLKDSFNLEAIIRWMLDRKFASDNFKETKKLYVFNQQNDTEYLSHEYKVIEGTHIAVELGSEKSGLNKDSIHLDEFIQFV